MSVRPPPLTNPRIRVATAADKNSYVRATRAGYELDLQFRWRYPFRCDFPEDAIEAMGGHFDEAVGDERATVLVAEVPRLEGGVEMGGGGGEWVIIGGVVWVWKFADEVEGEISPIGFSLPSSPRRDMDPTRQAQFISAITAAEKKYLGAQWGPKRLELADCAVDPVYQRRGAGRALVEWGLQMARRDNVPVTLTASPMGRALYLSLGFRELGRFDVGEGEAWDGERVRTWVMVWVPEGWGK